MNDEMINWIFKSKNYSSGIKGSVTLSLVIKKNIDDSIVYEDQVFEGITLREFLFNLQKNLNQNDFSRIADEVVDHLLKEINFLKIESINQIIVVQNNDYGQIPIFVCSNKPIREEHEEKLQLNSSALSPSIINQLSMTFFDYTPKEIRNTEIDSLIKRIDQFFIEKSKVEFQEKEIGNISGKGLNFNKGFKIKKNKTKKESEVYNGMMTSVTSFTYSKLSDIVNISHITKDLDWSNILQNSKAFNLSKVKKVQVSDTEIKPATNCKEILIKGSSDKSSQENVKRSEKIETLVSQLKIILSP